jgi:hypothetical protein
LRGCIIKEERAQDLHGGRPLVGQFDPDAEFVSEVIRVVQQTLTSRFGADVTNVILFNFQNSMKLKREDIVKKPESFETFLDSMFGHGSRILRKLIVKSLEEHFKLESGKGSVDLSSTLITAWKARQALSA